MSNNQKLKTVEILPDTSGHADTAALKDLVKAINPKNIVPIHTFSGSAYKNIFSAPIVELNDGETKQVL